MVSSEAKSEGEAVGLSLVIVMSFCLWSELGTIGSLILIEGRGCHCSAKHPTKAALLLHSTVGYKAVS